MQTDDATLNGSPPQTLANERCGCPAGVYPSRQPGFFRYLWNWLAGLVVRDAPDDLTACAFDCNKPRCSPENWENCKRRLNAMNGDQR